MFTPHTYSTALLLMTLSMLCWGSQANTQKLTGGWPFELYYFDYSLGLLACALIIGLTLGQMNPASPDSFFLNLRAASPRSLWLAFAGGAIFSVGNILIVAAIAAAGMAVAFPIGAGLALVLGAVLNDVVSPAGNPVLRRPISGPPLELKDYGKGTWKVHGSGIAGGLIRGVGTIANFVASYVLMIGPATSFSMGEGNTMISALWGVFVWKEFRGASGRVRLSLALMFLCFYWG